MATQSSPVFIVGIARSGTSALYLALQRHASFRPTRTMHGFDLTESRLFLDPSAARRRAGPAWDFLLRDDAAFGKLQHDLRSVPHAFDAIHTSRVLQRIVGRRASTRLLAWRLCRRDVLVRTYFTHAAHARGARRLVEKTPDHLYRLREIRATFPSARIVCTIRHPLDVFRSYRRRLIAAADGEPADSPIVRWLRRMDASSFVSYYRSIAREAAHAGGALVVRYEDFTTEPSDVFHRICKFLDEPFDARCVEESTPALHDFMQDPRLAQPIRPNESHWSDLVAHDEAVEIENKLASAMQQLGYARRT